MDEKDLKDIEKLYKNRIMSHGYGLPLGKFEEEYCAELLSENKKLTIQEINRVSERSSFDFNYKYKTDTWTATRGV